MDNKIQKLDTQLSEALAFFGITSDNIEKARDLRWLEMENVKHQLFPKKKAQSNKYYAIIKDQQHRLDYIAEKLNDLSAMEEGKPIVGDWFNQEVKQNVDHSATVELQQFKQQLDAAFKKVSVQDGEVQRKKRQPQQRNQKYTDVHNDLQTSFSGHRGTYNNPQQSKYQHQYNSNSGTDGLCKAGAVLSIISASITLLMSFAWWTTVTAVRVSHGMHYTETFNMWGMVWSALCLWTIIANAQILSGTAKSKYTAGVTGLLFGWFLGGILTLAGRYKND